MSLYIQNGTKFTVTKRENLNATESLPTGTYVVEQNPETGIFYLNKVDDFIINFKLYENVESRAKRILNTFKERPFGTGVMLNGEKGSGKTLLAKKISIEAAKMGFSTILVNRPFFGPVFNNFIQTIEPAVIFFDEFEKVYSDKEAQENILTLLDGAFPSKKLYILTVNDAFRTDAHMRNRPGRIYYFIDFTGLSAEFVREFCEDRLQNKSYIGEIVNLAKLLPSLNFDMLAALVEEMNRYGESPKEVLNLINIRMDGGKIKYDIIVKKDGNIIPTNPARVECNLFTEKNIYIATQTDKEEDYFNGYVGGEDITDVKEDLITMELEGFIFEFHRNRGESTVDMVMKRILV